MQKRVEQDGVRVTGAVIIAMVRLGDTILTCEVSMLVGAQLGRWAPWTRQPLVGRRVVFCLPHAGGAASYYRAWQQEFDDEVAVFCPLELPGRGARLDEPLVTDGFALAQRIVTEVIDAAQASSFLLLGHSFGALLAFLVTRQLERAGGQTPSALFVSAARPPSVLWQRACGDVESAQQAKTFLLAAAGTDAAMLEWVRPASLEALTTDLAMFRPPTIPADARVMASVVAFAGGADRIAPPHLVRMWSNHAESVFEFHEFRGGHFFINDHRAAISKLLRDRVRMPA